MQEYCMYFERQREKNASVKLSVLVLIIQHPSSSFSPLATPGVSHCEIQIINTISCNVSVKGQLIFQIKTEVLSGKPSR